MNKILLNLGGNTHPPLENANLLDLHGKITENRLHNSLKNKLGTSDNENEKNYMLYASSNMAHIIRTFEKCVRYIKL